MKKDKLLSLMFLCFTQLTFSQLETKPFVLNKEDYHLLEDKNLLVSEAIIHAFGESGKENAYKLEIDQVDAWNSRVKEFKYFPNPNEDSKSELKAKALKYNDNYNIELRVKVNKTKSLITEKIKPYLDKKNCFVLSITVIGNPKIFVTEVRNSDKLKEIVTQKSFAEKAFKKRFGDKEKNKYTIGFESIHTCLIKDLYDPKCLEEYDIQASDSQYDQFTNKITSEEYRGAYVLFSIPLLRKTSKLNANIEDFVLKEADGTEFIKFYFCIPQDPSIAKNTKNLAPKSPEAKSTILGSIKGKLLNVNTKLTPILNETIELKGMNNTLVQTQKTDGQGTFEFKDIDLENTYTFDLPNYKPEDKNSKVYIANLNEELVKELKKDENNKFTYKTIEADLFKLNTMNEKDVELTFSKQKTSNSNIIVIQEFIYYDFNSFKILPESKPTLDKIVKILIENKNYKLEIISHTDSRGEDSENLSLSQKRSESVLNYILTNKNLDPKRITPLGMGESSPLNSCLNGKNCLESEFKMNRRTEFVFKRT